ncbi:MAG: ribosome recycling factor [Runella slithyformis]|jgi:ribosome recycling factor|nr:MAG: ribosome recycling factor [Runella slithyformis]TAF93999.1 MAG: ribosome recycling factor [Runella sp.]TAG17770.1 MAG: ribosome recycling factor [Cytophagales bacterium]TAG37357.1 MAG: ribosome recycling factor [Cytophagia bacterium]TAE98263.1 MAG: ribosome recycling factor [Runella slithyformis]
MEEVELYLDDAKDTMERALKHLNIELSKIRAGRASAQMLDGIQVEYYGVMSSLSNVASVSAPDARTIAVKPFERKIIGDIEKAIRNSNVGLNPTNDGDTIRLNVPPLTEERRRDLVKKVRIEIETAKVNVRNIRQDSNNAIRKLTKEGVAEDDVKKGEERIQKITDSYITKVEQIFTQKEQDIMSV